MAVRTWWKFDLDMCKLPEIAELADQLQLPAVAAAGYTALLYAWGISNAGDDGDISRYTHKAIETACGWEGTRGDLLNAFHASGIIYGDLDGEDDDAPLTIANWFDLMTDIRTQRDQTRQRVQKHRNKTVTDDVTRYVTDDVTKSATSSVTPPRIESGEEKIKNSRINSTRERASPSPAATPALGLEEYARMYLARVSDSTLAKLLDYRRTFPDAVIQYAIGEACAIGKRSVGYTCRILDRYAEDGLKTIADVKADAERQLHLGALHQAKVNRPF